MAKKAEKYLFHLIFQRNLAKVQNSFALNVCTQSLSPSLHKVLPGGGFSWCG